MARHPWLLAVWSLVLAPCAATAQEYTIKLKQPALNDTVLVKKTDRFQLEFTLTDAAGNSLQSRKEAKTLIMSFHETGLERAEGARQFTSLKRDYQKAERVTDKVKDTLLYQGKTVVIDKKEGKYSFRIDGGDQLDGKDAEELNDEFNKNILKKLNADLFLPKNPVKVGEPWKFDVIPFARELGKTDNFAFDEAKTSGTGKLLKAFTKDDRPFGVIETVVDFTITHLVDPQTGIKTPCKEGKLRLKVTTAACIDGSREQTVAQYSWDGDIRADFDANGMKLSLTVVLRGTLEESRTEAK